MEYIWCLIVKEEVINSVSLETLFIFVHQVDFKFAVKSVLKMKSAFLEHPVHVRCVGSSAACFTRLAVALLYAAVSIKRDVSPWMTIFSPGGNRLFYDGHLSLYPAVRRRQFIAVVPRGYNSSVSYERSFTLIPDISARIDYASSSLSDVLVSIGNRCGRNAHVPVFSTRIARFPMPV